MDNRPPDFEMLAEALERHGVRYVVVGGMAVLLRAGNRMTFDVDLALALDRDNLERTAAALNELNPRLRSGSRITLDATAFAGEFVRFRTDAGQLDVIVRLDNVGGFDSLMARAERMRVGKIEANLASIEDLLIMKTGTDRPQDKQDIATLEVIRRIQAGEIVDDG